MKQKRFNVEEIVAILKQAELGVLLADLVRWVGISELSAAHSPRSKRANRLFPVIAYGAARRPLLGTNPPCPTRPFGKTEPALLSFRT